MDAETHLAKTAELKEWRQNQLAELQEKAIVIKGKQYVQVANRVLAFNDIFPEGSLTTEMLSAPDATLVVFKATASPDGKRFFTGHSQATWGDGYINKTSALENAETSAVGRALGMMGIGVIDSIASVDELVKANGRAKGDPTAAEHESNFLDPEARLPVVRINAIIEACNRNGHSTMAQQGYLDTLRVKQWEQVTNAQFADAIKWASRPSSVPQDLESVAKESLGMVSAAKALASAVEGMCSACGSKQIPSGVSKKTGKKYAAFCSNAECVTRQRI